jgi:uncharacterized iron-regulated membrane protein
VHPGKCEILVERCARDRNKGESVMQWLFPLHGGMAFGTAGKMAMLLTFSTGLWIWLCKQRTEQFVVGRRARSLLQGETLAAAFEQAMTLENFGGIRAG